MPRKIEVSHRTIIFTVALLISLWFLYTIREILLVLFVSLLIMAILNPLVTNLSKYKVPRPLSVIMVYLITISLIVFSTVAIIPPLVTQTETFFHNFPKYLDRLGLPYSTSDQLVDQFTSELGNITSGAAQFTASVFSSVIGVLTVLVFTFYLLTIREKLDLHLNKLVGEEKRREYMKLVEELEQKLGGWAKGQLILMVVVGVCSYVGLRILGMPYALPLSIFAGVFELVPYLGPTLSAVPPAIIGFSLSPFLGFGSLALSFLIQQLENYVLVPKVMEKSAGVNPVATLIALAVGFQLAGVVGVLLAVPCVIILQALLSKNLLLKFRG